MLGIFDLFGTGTPFRVEVSDLDTFPCHHHHHQRLTSQYTHVASSLCHPLEPYCGPRNLAVLPLVS